MEHYGDEAQAEPQEAPLLSPAPAAPITSSDRISELDLLRGFAVLGILLVNMWSFGLPFPAAVNPRLIGFDQGLDAVVYTLVAMISWFKTMPLFSMLFGAGIVLFTQRLEDRGLKPRGPFYRRQLWLLIIGLLHAYLLWDGDILVPYAVCGMILYLFRRRRPRTLVILALFAMMIPMVTMNLGAGFMEKYQQTGEEAEAALAAGDTLSTEQQEGLEAWYEQRAMWDPTAEDFDDIVEIMRGDYPSIVNHRAGELAVAHLISYPLSMGWSIAGLMLLGMALFKAGIMRGDRSTGYYVWLAVIGYGLGLSGTVVGLRYLDIHHDSFAAILRVGFPIIATSGTLVALGHVAVIILAHRRGWLGSMKERLVAVGRMAFTNYLSQTLIGTTLFYGYGFGLFGAMSRLELAGVMILIWILQLWWSPLWLARYRFGPCEWAWRSLTYKRRQHLRRRPEQGSGMSV